MDAPGAVATVLVGAFDNSVGLTKTPVIRDTRQVDSADAGSRGENISSFIG